MHKLSKYVWNATGESRPFCRENLFSPKKTLKQRFTADKESLSKVLSEVAEITRDSVISDKVAYWAVLDS